MSLFEADSRRLFLKKLFSWYQRHGRHDMPWRHTSDPYAIVVSEFMLQQTTVNTVKPYYERFLQRFPTLQSLADAPIDRVLSLWSGLGYYARARNLWSAMGVVRDHFCGQIPRDVESLMKLPGVGPYTAGAIATIAFNAPAAVLDGNIIRVLMRVLAIDDDPKMKAVLVVLRKIALDLSLEAKGKKTGPRELSLALMDLGATVCVPGTPQCADCPVVSLCSAHQHGRQNEIPPAGEKVERPTVRRLHAIVEHQSQWLMARRPEGGLFGGLWEFPGVDAPASSEMVPFLEKAVQSETGLNVRVKEAVPFFEHHLSHRIFIVRGYLCDLISGELLEKGVKYESFRWIRPHRMSTLGLSAVTKRLINTIVLDRKKPKKNE